MAAAPWAVRWGVVGWILLIGAITLSFPDDQPTNPFRLCLFCSPHATLADFGLNVALYVPLGFLLRRYTGRVAVAAAVGLLLAVGVEAAQLFLPGRFSTLEDVIANGAGAGLGALLGVAPSAWLTPGPRMGRALATGTAGLAALALLLPAYLLDETVPEGELFALWTPTLAHAEVYRGRVLEAHVGDVFLRHGRVGRSGDARRGLEAGATVELRFVAGPPPSSFAPILRVVAGRGVWDEALEIAADRHDLVIRLQYRADETGLERPQYRLRGALADYAVGDTVAVTLSPSASGGHGVRVGAAEEVRVGWGVERGWSLLRFPQTLSAGLERAADFAWLFLLAFPVGWWAREPRPVAALGVVLLLTAGLAPTLGPLTASGWIAYVGLTAGLLVATLLRRVTDPPT